MPKSWTTATSDRRGSIAKRRMKDLETLERVLVRGLFFVS